MNSGKLGCLLILRNEAGKNLRRNQSLCGEDRYLLRDVLQLAHITRPLVTHNHLLCLLSQHNLIHVILLSHLHGKETEQQYDVLTTVTKRRNLNGNRIQSVIKVFAEASFTDSLTDIDIRRSHYTDIRLTYLCGSYRDILSSFQHTQQPCLCGKRQFTYLVKEQRSFIGDTEIAGRIIDGSCKRTLYVSEQLTVNSTFRNRTAVDGEILLAFTGRVVVNDTRNNLLTNTAFSYYEHT